MSYDQLSSLESGRRGGYTDNPGFQDLQYELKTKLQSLLSSNRKLANDVNVLGTKKDTPRLRERVHNTMEKARELCREIGDGVKRLQTWEDLSVRCPGRTRAQLQGLTQGPRRSSKSMSRPRCQATSKQHSRSFKICSEGPWRRKRHPFPQRAPLRTLRVAKPPVNPARA